MAKPTQEKTGEHVVVEKIDPDVPQERGQVEVMRRQLDELKLELRRRDEITMAEKNAAQRQLDELTSELLRQGEQLADLSKQVAGMTVSRPRELSADEAVEIMAREPNRRFVVVAYMPSLGLKPGEILDPRARFADPARDLPQHIANGLRIAATAA